jgi:hypothetical protein
LGRAATISEVFLRSLKLTPHFCHALSKFGILPFKLPQ